MMDDSNQMQADIKTSSLLVPAGRARVRVGLSNREENNTTLNQSAMDNDASPNRVIDILD